VQLLENHPWFEVTALTGSDRSVGQLYGEACRWVLDKPMPDYARSMKVVPTEPGLDAAIAFSALPADQAKAIEPAFAQAGHGVCSNASTYRMDPDVPLLIPEVNPDHTALIKVQQAKRGWSGFIATNPNCTSTGFTIAFRPLLDTFGIKKAFVVSMQAVHRR
jgi:aspartate-semialdehyde dehydrogenase